MTEDSSTQASFWPGRRWRIGLNVALSIAALAGVMLLANFISARHFRRLEWSSPSEGRLSPVTARVLNALTNKVKIVVFFDHRRPMFSAVRKLLNEYEVQCSKLEVEYVDYTIAPGRAEQIRTTYELDPADKADRIIFSCNGKKRVVHARELSEYDYSGVFTERKIKLASFKGEQTFTSALCGVIDPRPIKAYFLEGHREHDPTDTDDQRGYLDFARILQESNIAVGHLSLLTNDIPADCQLLIVANPLTAMGRAELESIDKYLNRGGRLLALFSLESVNIQTGMEKLLEDWGVDVGRDWVTDRLLSKSDNPELLVVTDFADHAIVKPLRRSRLVLAAPRSIGRKTASNRGADAAKVSELAFTSAEGIVHTGPGKVQRTGRIPLMVAVEKGSIQGISADRAETRIVVTGDSMFLGNDWIDQYANRDLARLAVNWLVNREVLLEAIGARPIKEFTLAMTHSEMRTIRWLLVAVMPGGVLFLGFLVWARRRN